MQKLDFTKPETLQRLDGGEFRILATNIPGEKPIAAAMRSVAGFWFCDLICDDGKYCFGKESGYDIIPKPPRVTGWVNVYQFGDRRCNTSDVFESQIAAKSLMTKGCIGQAYIDAEIQW